MGRLVAPHSPQAIRGNRTLLDGGLIGFHGAPGGRAQDSRPLRQRDIHDGPFLKTPRGKDIEYPQQELLRQRRVGGPLAKAGDSIGRGPANTLLRIKEGSKAGVQVGGSPRLPQRFKRTNANGGILRALHTPKNTPPLLRKRLHLNALEVSSRPDRHPSTTKGRSPIQALPQIVLHPQRGLGQGRYLLCGIFGCGLLLDGLCPFDNRFRLRALNTGLGIAAKPTPIAATSSTHAPAPTTIQRLTNLHGMARNPFVMRMARELSTGIALIPHSEIYPFPHPNSNCEY
jgi:hypothetical protein